MRRTSLTVLVVATLVSTAARASADATRKIDQERVNEMSDPNGFSEDSMVRVANALGHAPTPTVDLLRIGFLF